MFGIENLFFFGGGKKEEKEENCIILCFNISDTLIGVMQKLFNMLKKQIASGEKATENTLKMPIHFASGYKKTNGVLTL